MKWNIRDKIKIKSIRTPGNKEWEGGMRLLVQRDRTLRFRLRKWHRQ